MFRKQTSFARFLALAIAVAFAVSASPSRAAALKECAVPDLATTPVERLGGKRFSVEVRGTGPDVVLIPGLSTSRSVWDGTVKALDGKYRLHLVQIRGFGDDAGVNGEGPVLEPFVAELADYIDDEITNKGRAAPAIIGHSLGGLTALMIGARYPQLAGRLMIVDSLPFIGTMVDPGATVATIEPRAKAMADGMRARPSAAARTPITADPGPMSLAGFMSLRPEGRIAVANLIAGADSRVTAQLFYEDSITDMRPELAKISAPVLLLYAHDASLMSADEITKTFEPQFAGVANFKAQRVEDSRHFIMLDQPDIFHAAVKAFVEH
ncbi:MAG: alpha/beta hydrolase [Sphingorhabdus sp.]